MGMNFSPMYQPVSTKTIKADGDLNVSPYDVEAYDGRFDTVEADEFVGGVGNFSSTTVRGTLNTTDIRIGSYTQTIDPITYAGPLSIGYQETYTVGSITVNDLTTASQYVYYNIGELLYSTYPINLSVSASIGNFAGRVLARIYVNNALVTTTGALNAVRTATINVKKGDTVRVDLYNSDSYFSFNATVNVTFTCNGEVYLL